MNEKKPSFAQKQCITSAGKIMHQTGMLWPGARIGVALSGGVDSWTMLKVLLIRQRIIPFYFEIMVLHINPGFDPQNHLPLITWLTKNPVSAHIECTDIGPYAHSEANIKKSPCFICAWNRRKKLFELCSRYNLTHLALGHTKEDLAETFFLNMLQNGNIRGLKANESFFSGKLNLIRPMLLTEKNKIIQAAKKWRLPVWNNPCPSAWSSKRKQMLQRIDSLCANDKTTRKNIFNAISRWQLDLDTGLI
ncbi:MAG: tRNA 2-thiocytidine biosynthesis TtcA family protein [Desulfovibrionales bacterium]